MELTYILVDFENIQPQDMGLLTGEQYQLRIFRGPHPKNRPVKRKTLESHITSLLGGNVAPKAVRGLIAGLENEGIVKFTENKIDEYKIPKRK